MHSGSACFFFAADVLPRQHRCPNLFMFLVIPGRVRQLSFDGRSRLAMVTRCFGGSKTGTAVLLWRMSRWRWLKRWLHLQGKGASGCAWQASDPLLPKYRPVPMKVLLL